MWLTTPGQMGPVATQTLGSLTFATDEGADGNPTGTDHRRQRQHGPDAELPAGHAGPAAAAAGHRGPPGTAGGDQRGTETVVASVTDLDAMTAACAGVDAVIHLGGISKEAPFEEILDVNVRGTYCVLEAAHRQGVGAGGAGVEQSCRRLRQSLRRRTGRAGRRHRRPPGFLLWLEQGDQRGAGPVVRRHLRHGRVRIRIGSSFDEPFDVRSLATWMSPDDTARLMRCLPGDIARRLPADLGHLAEHPPLVGYVGRRRDRVPAGRTTRSHTRTSSSPSSASRDPDDPVHHLVGGKFCAVPLGERMV